MNILTREKLESEKLKVVRKLRECIFIYPTDTVYGIGCNATDRKLVRKLRCAKEQYSRPLSVIAPSVDWIRKNCQITEQAEEWLAKLPGPYTLILNLKEKDAIASNVNLGKETIGIRIPDHWFYNIVKEMKVPIITTSANITGGNFMTSLANLNIKIDEACSYVIYEGPNEGNPSKIVDLTSDEVKILRS